MYSPFRLFSVRKYISCYIHSHLLSIIDISLCNGGCLTPHKLSYFLALLLTLTGFPSPMHTIGPKNLITTPPQFLYSFFLLAKHYRLPCAPNLITSSYSPPSFPHYLQRILNPAHPSSNPYVSPFFTFSD